MIQDNSIQAVSSQVMSSEQREWMLDPWSRVPDTETLKNISFLKGTRKKQFVIVDPNVVLTQLRKGVMNGDVDICVMGLSGAGKSQILEGINDVLDRDEYLQEEMRRRGLTLKRRAFPFSMGIKAAQIPKDKGGPGIIPLTDQNGNPIIHGGFSVDQYADGSRFIGEASEKILENKNSKERFVKFREAPGMPFITKQGVPVEIEGMADRGNTPIYNTAYSRERKGKYLFIVMRQENVGESSRMTRSELDPQGDMGKIFNSGIDYVATNREGVKEHIADAPEAIQRDVVKLLRLATANDDAIKRSNREYYEMVADLQNRGIIPDTDALSYARVLRNKLMWGAGRPGLPGDQIYLVSNYYSKSLRANNTYNLDIFLRDNYWALTYREKLVPASLCELYLPAIA